MKKISDEQKRFSLSFEKLIIDVESENEDDEIIVDELIISGEGGFGKIHRIEVKKEILDKYNELQILMKMNNDHIVKIFNLNMNKEKPFIIMETYEQDLENIMNEMDLEKQKMNLIQNFVINIEIFQQLLESINYLHSNNPMIVHGNLKPTNILVKYTNDCAILILSDFGYTQLNEKNRIESDISSTGASKYLKYKAPEHGSNISNTKSDIFSFGIIVSEIFEYVSQKIKSENFSSRKVSSTNSSKFMRTIDEVEERCINNIKYIDDLKLRMSNISPENRPSCSEILRDINKWKIDHRTIQTEVIQPTIFSDAQNFFNNARFHHYLMRLKIYEIFQKKLKENIKFIYFKKLDFPWELFITCVTIYDQVFHSLAYSKEIELKELRGKNISNFFCGDSLYLAFNDYYLYSWGNNYQGQLGRNQSIGVWDNKPGLISFPNERNIKIIRAFYDSFAVMVIFENNNIYVWGNISFDEISSENIDFLSKPQIFAQEQFIRNLFEPIPLWVNRFTFEMRQLKFLIKQACVDLYKLDVIDFRRLFPNMYFLCENGKILTSEYEINETNEIYNGLIELKSDEKFKKIEVIGKSVVAMNENNVFEIIGHENICIKTDFENFENYSIYKHECTYETFEI